MRKIKEFLRPWFTQGTAIGILLLILAFQPMIDLDYLIYPYLNQFGLPRPSTIIRYLLIPALIVGCCLLYTSNRRFTDSRSTFILSENTDNGLFRMCPLSLDSCFAESFIYALFLYVSYFNYCFIRSSVRCFFNPVFIAKC